MKSYGLVGTATQSTVDDDWDPTPYGGLAPGWILMSELWPTTRPDRFGDWIAQSDGTWVWVKQPDPPFPIVFHEGKLKNQDTMEEIAIETLPGNVAARLTTLENPAPPPPTTPTP